MNYIRVNKRPVETVRDPRSLTRLAPMMFATALFVIIATAHVLATVKLSARDESIQVDIGTAKNIRLVETIGKNAYFGMGYGVLCVTMLWFSAFRRYPLWTGWLILIALAAPWLLYLRACAFVVHNVLTILPP